MLRIASANSPSPRATDTVPMESRTSATAKQRSTTYVVVALLSAIFIAVLTAVSLTWTREAPTARDFHAARKLRAPPCPRHACSYHPYHCAGVLFQDTSPVWDLGGLAPTAMYFEPTVHYELNSTMADKEWASLVPSNGGIVRIGPDREPYHLSMFHQLRCLDIIRRSYNAREGLTPGRLNPAAHHCLHYLRQMMLCRRDTRIEPVIDTGGPHAVQPWGLMTCRDWRGVYEASTLR